MSESRITAIVALVLIAGTAGCNKPERRRETAAAPATELAPKAPATVAESTAGGGSAEAQKIFKARCSVCHGPSGRGDGPGAAALNPKPRDYTNTEWQKSVSDEEISKTILYGGAAVGKSPNMPGNPDLESKPQVIQGLVSVVRGFRKN
jgi:mono/diheme cytochrome c family protein